MRRAARYPLKLTRALARELFFTWKPRRSSFFCGGSGVVRRALHGLFNAPTIAFDTRYRVSDNICHIGFQEMFEYCCQHSLISGVKLAFPCSTFSDAQSGGGTAIRTQAHPRGVDGPLTETQRNRAREGNQLLAAAIVVFKIWQPQ